MEPISSSALTTSAIVLPRKGGSMIAIINVEALDGDPLGECQYEVRINKEVRASFKHRRRAGLAACLRAAADAVEENPYAIIGSMDPTGGRRCPSYSS